MFSIYLLILVTVAAILLALICTYEYRHRLDPAPKPCWPPTCNADVEAKINELVREIKILKIHIEQVERVQISLVGSCVFKKVKKNVD